MLDQKYTTFIELIRQRRPENLHHIELCMKLLSATKAIDRSCAAQLDEYDLSESRLLVLTLLKEKGALTPQVIADFCGVSKASMTQQINTLFNDGMIEKSEVLEDKRKYAVLLTDKGRDIIERAFAEHTTWIKSITKSLSDDEMTQLDAILSKIIINVTKIHE